MAIIVFVCLLAIILYHCQLDTQTFPSCHSAWFHKLNIYLASFLIKLFVSGFVLLYDMTKTLLIGQIANSLSQEEGLKRRLWWMDRVICC